jgi:YHS domain-containing protein
MKGNMMTRSLFVLASAAVAGLVFSTVTGAEEKQEKKFTATCPVSGQPAKEDSSLSYLGKKVYFCCNNCPKAFEKDTKKYAAKANYQLLQTEQIVAVACPLTGRKLNPATAIDVNGVKVAFCCNNCKGKAEKADDVVALVFTKLDKGFTLQTTCPVSGKAIKAEHVVKHKGENVYFCCPNCPKAFSANPEKFVGKLPQFQQKEKKEKQG